MHTWRAIARDLSPVHSSPSTTGWGVTPNLPEIKNMGEEVRGQGDCSAERHALGKDPKFSPQAWSHKTTPHLQVLFKGTWEVTRGCALTM